MNSIEEQQNRIDQLERQLMAMEAFVKDNHQTNMILFSLLLGHAERTNGSVSEQLRLILQNQVDTAPLSQSMKETLRALRGSLVAGPDAATVSTLLTPPVRPVN